MPETVTRREWLMRVLYTTPSIAPVNAFMVDEAIASVALSHPEGWLDERKTWDEWADGPQDGQP